MLCEWGVVVLMDSFWAAVKRDLPPFQGAARWFDLHPEVSRRFNLRLRFAIPPGGILIPEHILPPQACGAPFAHVQMFYAPSAILTRRSLAL